MANYTTLVRTICEVNSGYDESVGFDDVDEVIQKSIPNIFNFDFPIFDPSYKSVLCGKILLEYYMREIGFETVGLWKLRMRAKLNKIMPYYNKLYESELLKFDPFYDVDLNRTHNKNQNDTNTSIGSINVDEMVNTLQSNNYSKTLSGNKNEDVTFVEGEVGNSTNKGTVTDKGKTTSTLVNDSTNVVTYDSTIKDTLKGKAINKQSDTPQSTIAQLENDKYLTKAVIDSDDKTQDKSVKDNTKNVTTVLDDGLVDSTNTNTTDLTATNRVDKNATNKVLENFSNRDSGESNTDIYNNKVNNTSNTNNVNATSIEDYMEKITGKTGGVSYSKLLKEFRETFLNIDSMIIDEISDLFMNLY